MHVHFISSFLSLTGSIFFLVLALNSYHGNLQKTHENYFLVAGISALCAFSAGVFGCIVRISHQQNGKLLFDLMHTVFNIGAVIVCLLCTGEDCKFNTDDIALLIALGILCISCVLGLLSTFTSIRNNAEKKLF